MEQKFQLMGSYTPKGDQPQAIEALVTGLKQGLRDQVLLGVTGSGKTFTIANVIAQWQRPTLVIAPNKTLAAQLFNEFHLLFPENAVEYFISYYDYYQPEAYLPQSDTYIEKDSAINEQIDKLRHQATKSILSRQDVIIVASVSAIYNMGAPENYGNMTLALKKGTPKDLHEVLKRLTLMQYRRVIHEELSRGTYRLLGNRCDIYPVYDDFEAIRLTFFGNTLEKIEHIDSVSGFVYTEAGSIDIYPASHYAVEPESVERALKSIEEELTIRVRELRQLQKHLEATRLEERTREDIEMLKHFGFCKGIENYSRHFENRKAGDPPYTLMDYFPKDFLLIIDESHITLPQVRGMYHGDTHRKRTLVEYGFRLPSALDNRPLAFEEFNQKIHQVIHASATPKAYEIQLAGGSVVEQINRPTGLVDPEVFVYPAKTQVDHLLSSLRDIIAKDQRVLVLTLTKKMAETFAGFLLDMNIAATYLHADVKTIDRTKILENFRRGDVHVLVGINLLREGIDLPEVGLVAILDADKEGFLRSQTALIQMMGRAARNVDGKVFVYADRETDSIRSALQETRRRREIQLRFNQDHGIVPTSIQKPVTNVLEERLLAIASGSKEFMDRVNPDDTPEIPELTPEERADQKKLLKRIKDLRKQMRAHAQHLEFEKAQVFKTAILQCEQALLQLEQSA